MIPELVEYARWRQTDPSSPLRLFCRRSAPAHVLHFDRSRGSLRLTALPRKKASDDDPPAQYWLPVGMRSSDNVPYAVCDTAEYVLGISTGKDARAAKRHKLYLNLLERIADELHNSDVRALAAAIRALPAIEADRLDTLGVSQQALQEAGVKDAEALAKGTVVVLVDDKPVFDLDSPVMCWWQQYAANECFAPAKKPSAGWPSCAVCGEANPSALAGTRQLTIGGAANLSLISFNDAAFESFGFKGGQNSRLCTTCMEAALSALQEIVTADTAVAVRKHATRSTRNGRVAIRGQVGVVCAWTTQPSDSLDDLLAALDNPDPQEIQDLLKSPYRAEPPNADPESGDLIVAYLTPRTKGRISVRRFNRFSEQRFAASVLRWFNSHALQVRGQESYQPLGRILDALAPSKEAERRGDRNPRDTGRIARQPLLNGILDCVFFGAPAPAMLTRVAVRRYTQTLRQTRDKPGSWPEDQALHQLAAVLRAGLLLAATPTTTDDVLTPMLNPDHPAPAYHLGRLMAIYQIAQSDAHNGPVNAGVTDRFFDSFMRHPASTLPALHQLHLTHLRKLRRNNPARAYAHQKRVDEILGRIDRTNLPTFLPPEQQAVFILGFHQQRDAVFTRKADDQTKTTPSAEQADNKEQAS